MKKRRKLFLKGSALFVEGNLNTATEIEHKRVHYELIYAAAILFGSFTLFLAGKLLFSKVFLSGWIAFFTILLSFALLWLLVSTLLKLFRKTPLIMTGGFLALFIISGAGLFFTQDKFSIADILVAIPFIVLLTFLYYFKSVYTTLKINKDKPNHLVLVLFFVDLIFLLWFSLILLAPGDDSYLRAVEPVKLSRLNQFSELSQEGIYNYSILKFTTNSKNNKEKIVLEPLVIDLSKYLSIQNNEQTNTGSSQIFSRYGEVYLPEGEGPFPLVYINSELINANELGFAYLGKHLASKGYLTAIFPELDIKKANVLQNKTDRYWFQGVVLLETIKGLERTLKDIRIDTEKIALIGFQEGVRTTAAACYINQENCYPLDGKISFSDRYKIVSLIALVPPSNYVLDYNLPSVNYISVFGGHDAIKHSFSDPLFNQIKCSGDNSFKSQIYIYRANRNFFLSSKADLDFPGRLLVNKKPLMTAQLQKDITRSIVTAALEISLNNRLKFSELFYNHNLRQLCQDEYLVVRTISSNDKIITDFENGYNYKKLNIPNASLELSEGLKWSVKDLGNNKALQISIPKSEEETSISLSLPSDFSKKAHLSSKSAFCFSLAALTEEIPAEIFLQIETIRGESEKIKLSETSPLPQYAPVKYFKLVSLNQLYSQPIIMQTYSLPLYLFFSSFDYTPWLDIKSIKLIIPKGSQGQLLLDDIVFSY